MNLEDIRNIAVLGAGTMGPGIAQTFAMKGYKVNIYSRTQKTLDKAKSILKVNLETFVEEGLVDGKDVDKIMNRVNYVDNIEEAVDDVQFIVETVAEKPDIKTMIYKRLDEILPDDVYLASKTSSLNPFELMPEKRLPNTTTAHFFAPPHIIPLVEVAKGDKTSEKTMEVVTGLLKDCGKVPVRLEKFVPGYIINRIQILLNTEIFYLLDNGYCTPEQLDLAVKASLMPRGMVLGLVQRYDFTGLDISANNILNGSYVMPELPERPESLFDRVEKGELGVKAGKGFYDYDGKTVEEVSKKRDKMLFKVLKATEDLIYEKI